MNLIHEMIKWEKKDKKKKQQARYNPSVQGHTPSWLNKYGNHRKFIQQSK